MNSIFINKSERFRSKVFHPTPQFRAINKYILYRYTHYSITHFKGDSLMNIGQEILSDITIYMKYARYITNVQRRESWKELLIRNINMHKDRYPNLTNEIDEAYELVQDKKVLPSMRSLQFAGKPVEISPNRVYNCAYLPIDDWRAFSEVMFLLLGGTGVGYSVQQHHVDQLPDILLEIQLKGGQILSKF